MTRHKNIQDMRAVMAVQLDSESSPTNLDLTMEMSSGVCEELGINPITTEDSEIALMADAQPIVSIEMPDTPSIQPVYEDDEISDFLMSLTPSDPLKLNMAADELYSRNINDAPIAPAISHTPQQTYNTLPSVLPLSAQMLSEITRAKTDEVLKTIGAKIRSESMACKQSRIPSTNKRSAHISQDLVQATAKKSCPESNKQKAAFGDLLNQIIVQAISGTTPPKTTSQTDESDCKLLQKSTPHTKELTPQVQHTVSSPILTEFLSVTKQPIKPKTTATANKSVCTQKNKNEEIAGRTNTLEMTHYKTASCSIETIRPCLQDVLRKKIQGSRLVAIAPETPTTRQQASQDALPIRFYHALESDSKLFHQNLFYLLERKMPEKPSKVDAYGHRTSQSRAIQNLRCNNSPMQAGLLAQFSNKFVRSVNGGFGGPIILPNGLDDIGPSNLHLVRRIYNLCCAPLCPLLSRGDHICLAADILEKLLEEYGSNMLNEGALSMLFHLRRLSKNIVKCFLGQNCYGELGMYVYKFQLDNSSNCPTYTIYSISREALNFLLSLVNIEQARNGRLRRIVGSHHIISGEQMSLRPSDEFTFIPMLLGCLRQSSAWSDSDMTKLRHLRTGRTSKAPANKDNKWEELTIEDLK